MPLAEEWPVISVAGTSVWMAILLIEGMFPLGTFSAGESQSSIRFCRRQMTQRDVHRSRSRAFIGR